MPTEEQEPYDASDPEAVRQRELLSRIARKQRASDLATVCALPEGRRALRRILDRAGVWGGSYAGDPHKTAYNEGKRAIGIDLLMDIESLGREQLLAVLGSTDPALESPKAV